MANPLDPRRRDRALERAAERIEGDDVDPPEPSAAQEEEALQRMERAYEKWLDRINGS